MIQMIISHVIISDTFFSKFHTILLNVHMMFSFMSLEIINVWVFSTTFHAFFLYFLMHRPDMHILITFYFCCVFMKHRKNHHTEMVNFCTNNEECVFKSSCWFRHKIHDENMIKEKSEENGNGNEKKLNKKISN